MKKYFLTGTAAEITPITFLLDWKDNSQQWQIRRYYKEDDGRVYRYCNESKIMILFSLVNCGVLDENCSNWYRWMGQESCQNIISQLGVLSAICDADSNNVVKNLEKNILLIIMNRLDDMILSEEFDGAIIVITPTSTHAKIAKKLLEAKKHVFVEKPLTYKTEEGEDACKDLQKKTE